MNGTVVGGTMALVNNGGLRSEAKMPSAGSARPPAATPAELPHDPAVAKVDEATVRIQRAVSGIIAQIESGSSNAGSYATLLTGVGGQLADGVDQQTAKLLIASLIQATQSIAQKNHRLQEELTISTAQLSLISRELGEARREAWTDALTGLANRARFDLELDQATKDTANEGGSFCLALLDVDHFKRFNDSHGHVIGDEVLRLMGRILKQSLKGQDTPARYGGEEFGVILPDTKLEDATTLANRLRQRISSSALKNKATGESYGVITVSVGVTCFRRGETAATLIARADAALYAAKKAGRDRVIAEP